MVILGSSSCAGDGHNNKVTDDDLKDFLTRSLQWPLSGNPTALNSSMATELATAILMSENDSTSMMISTILSTYGSATRQSSSSPLKNKNSILYDHSSSQDQPSGGNVDCAQTNARTTAVEASQGHALEANKRILAPLMVPVCVPIDDGTNNRLREMQLNSLLKSLALKLDPTGNAVENLPMHVLCILPVNAEGEKMSLGSFLHFSGGCRSCIFHRGRHGCLNALKCIFCHYAHPKGKKRSRRNPTFVTKQNESGALVIRPPPQRSPLSCPDEWASIFRHEEEGGGRGYQSQT